MSTILLRKLTRKSIMGFGGDVKDLSVQQMFDSGRSKKLIQIYFAMSKIDFIPDILDEMCVPVEMRLNKPCKGLRGIELNQKIYEVYSLYLANKKNTYGFVNAEVNRRKENLTRKNHLKDAQMFSKTNLKGNNQKA